MLENRDLNGSINKVENESRKKGLDLKEENRSNRWPSANCNKGISPFSPRSSLPALSQRNVCQFRAEFPNMESVVFNNGTKLKQRHHVNIKV